MSLKLSDQARNARLDALEAFIGASALLRIYAGTAPFNTTDAPGTLLAEVALGSDWMAAASGGTKAKATVWQDTSANGTGQASYYRIYEATGATCHLQGTVSATGQGGELQVDSVNFVTGQEFVISAYTWTDGNPNG